MNARTFAFVLTSPLLATLQAAATQAADPAPSLTGDLARLQGCWTADAGARRELKVTLDVTGCAIQVSGDELYALSQPPSPERATAKIGRMRLGDCARQGCEACYYRLTFQNQPGIDWQTVLSEIEMLRQQRPGPVSGPTLHRLPWRGWMLSGLALRLGLALMLIAMLLLARQWRQGGRIPFLREPEHFRVDPAPQEQPAD